MNDMKILMPAAALLVLSACVFAVDGGGSAKSKTDRVDANAKAALETCGAGNVAAVSVRGYACKGADQEVIDALFSDEEE